MILDVFDKLLLNDKLNPNLPIDDLHLTGAWISDISLYFESVLC